MVKAAWARAAAKGEGPMLMQKIAQVHDELHVWDWEVLKAPTNRIRKMQKDLEKLRRGPMSDESVAAQKELLVCLELLMDQEELMWVQRFWNMLGDDLVREVLHAINTATIPDG